MFNILYHSLALLAVFFYHFEYFMSSTFFFFFFLVSLYFGWFHSLLSLKLLLMCSILNFWSHPNNFFFLNVVSIDLFASWVILDPVVMKLEYIERNNNKVIKVIFEDWCELLSFFLLIAVLKIIFLPIWCPKIFNYNQLFFF